MRVNALNQFPVDEAMITFTAVTAVAEAVSAAEAAAEVTASAAATSGGDKAILRRRWRLESRRNFELISSHLKW